MQSTLGGVIMVEDIGDLGLGWAICTAQYFFAVLE